MKRPKIQITTNIPSYVEWLGQVFKEGYEIIWEIPQQIILTKRIKPVDLIIFIPGSTDWRYLEELLKLASPTPFIVLSQEAKPEEVAYAFRKGVTDFLIKPDQNQIWETSIKYLIHSHNPSSTRFPKILGELGKYLNVNHFFPKKERLSVKQSTLSFQALSVNPYELEPAIPEVQPSPEEQGPSLSVQLLGKFELKINGTRMHDYAGKKGQALLSYLLYHYPRAIQKEVLMETFWPKVSSSSSRNSLNVALHGLRKAFEKYIPASDFLIYKHGAYSLNTDWNIQIDVKQFLRHWRNAQRVERATGVVSAVACYEKALSFYGGALLKDDLYSDWIQGERDNLQETYLAILERLIDYRVEVEEYEVAHHYGEQALRLDPCREHIHRQMMLAHCMSGRRNQAIRQYQRCCEVLDEELNISPSPKTQEMFQKIRDNKLC